MVKEVSITKFLCIDFPFQSCNLFKDVCFLLVSERSCTEIFFIIIVFEIQFAMWKILHAYKAMCEFKKSMELIIYSFLSFLNRGIKNNSNNLFVGENFLMF